MSGDYLSLASTRRRRRKTRLERLLDAQSTASSATTEPTGGPTLPQLHPVAPTLTFPLPDPEPEPEADPEDEPPPRLPVIRTSDRLLSLASYHWDTGNLDASPWNSGRWPSSRSVVPSPAQADEPLAFEDQDPSLFDLPEADPVSTLDSAVPDNLSVPMPRSRSKRARFHRSRSPRAGVGILRVAVLAILLGLLVGGVNQLVTAFAPDDEPATMGDEAFDRSQTNLPLGPVDDELRNRLTPLLLQPGLSVQSVFYDVDSQAYVEFEGSRPVAAASVIKVPILVAFFQAVDRGDVALDERLVLREEIMGGGSGTLQTLPLGTEVSALEAATLMITVSDNTATNLIMDRLGGMETLNTAFITWGLQETQLSWLLPDLEGTNKTSAFDIVTLLYKVEAGELLSRRSRDRLFDIMRRTQTQSLLLSGLGEDSRLANKTGDIRSALGDVGIIDLPNGHRYLASVLIEREAPNDPAAQALIQEMSGIAHDYWLTSPPSTTLVNTEPQE